MGEPVFSVTIKPETRKGVKDSTKNSFKESKLGVEAKKEKHEEEDDAPRWKTGDVICKNKGFWRGTGYLTKTVGMANEKGPQGKQQMQAPRRKYFGQKFFQQISIITISSCYLPSFSHSLHRHPKLISRVAQGSKNHNGGKDADVGEACNEYSAFGQVLTW